MFVLYDLQNGDIIRARSKETKLHAALLVYE